MANRQLHTIDEAIAPRVAKSIGISELLKAVSKGLGGAEVKFVRIETPAGEPEESVSQMIRNQIASHELEPKEVARRPANSCAIKKPVKKGRDLQLLLEYKQNKVAIAEDGTVWFLGNGEWNLMTEAVYPDLPEG